MDATRRHLNEVIAFHRSSDKGGLESLVSRQVSAEEVRSVLRNNRETSRTSSRKGCNALHIAAFRNAWKVTEIFKVLLEHNHNFISEPMDCGSYPLHILVGQSLTLQTEAVETLLHAGTPDIILRQDVNGDNPVSLLYKNVVRFRWAREAYEPTLSSLTIISPQNYRNLSLLLIAAALEKSVNDLTLHDICRMPRCPPLLVQLLLEDEHFQRQLVEPDSLGRYPLHWAAETRALTAVPIPLVALLHQRAPKVIGKTDHTGRLPLHHAVVSQSCPRTIRYLAQQYACWSVVDPVTGLFPAQAVATNTQLGTNLVWEFVLAGPHVVSI